MLEVRIQLDISVVHLLLKISNSKNEFTGDTKLGLMVSCMTLYNRPPICYQPDLKPEWWMALVCIVVGCVLIAITVGFLIFSHWNRNVIPYARWVGFTASM